MDAFVGEIRLVGFTFPPVDWMVCNGALLSIANYSTLFALIGTTYGGDGVNTFALPNLQSRVAAGFQAGPGLSNYTLGQTAGAENVALTTNQLPPHQHTYAGTVAAATAGTASNNPAGRLPGPAQRNLYATTPTTGATTVAGSVVGTATPNTGDQAHSNMPPVLALTYIIAVNGIFPSRQ